MVHLSLVVILLSSLTGCATSIQPPVTLIETPAPVIRPPVTLSDIRFFEQGPREGRSRKFQTQFDASSARYIAVELKLEHPTPDRVVEIPMSCRYVNAEGQTVGEPTWTHRVEPTWRGSYTVGVVGWSAPGKWVPGTYHVECHAESLLIANGSFEVVRQVASRPAPARKSPLPSSPSLARESRAASLPAPESSRPTTPVPEPVPPVAPPAAGPALPPSQPRRALVIGNTKYPDSPLRNPVNDATEMAALLRQQDFDVTLRLNADRHTMEGAIRDFTRRVPQGSVGLFYFSGHGVQIDGYNYLLPIDGVFHDPSDVKYRAVSADWVLEQMEDGGIDLKVLILDACRDNPFGRSGTRTFRRGLAPINSPKGSLIAYATSPGQTAQDGGGRHSPYTMQLLRQIPVAGRPMELTFKAVREGVQRETKGQQTPWEASSITGEFYFARR